MPENEKHNSGRKVETVEQVANPISFSPLQR
jgi:hypothetical protein